MPKLERYLGLPFRLGADPEDGTHADCFLLASRVVEAVTGTPLPLDRTWYIAARRNNWAFIDQEWKRRTRPACAPKPGCIACLPGDDIRTYLAIGPEGGVWSVHRQRGVIWLPLRHCQPLNWSTPL